MTQTGTHRASAAEDWIVHAVGDVARPRANVPVARDLRHLPGESGLWSGLRSIYGMFDRGNAFFLERREQFGDVYRTQFGPDPIVCVVDPELVFTILRNEDGIWSAPLGWRSLMDRIDPTTDRLDMLGALDFELHRDARRLMQPAFSNVAISGYIEAAIEEFAKAIATWKGEIAFKAAVRRVFAGVAGRIFIGVDDPGEIEMLDRSMAAFWGASMAAIKHPLLSPAWRRGVGAFRTLYQTLWSRVEERRRGPERPDLFTRLCKLPKDIAWIEDDTLVRLFIGIMVAAFDTTSFAVTSMAHLLAEHPDWQERLRAECKKVAPERLGRADLDELVETEWVWKETLRLFPVAPDTPRKNLKEVELGGHRLPAGTLVFSLIGPLMQHPSWWEAPGTFDPQRFSPERAEHKKHRAIYLPFGAGAHTCIGAQLSAVEAKVFFHHLLSKLRFRRADAGTKRRHQFRPMGQVSGPVRLVFEPV
jgi:cytochrome P450